MLDLLPAWILVLALIGTCALYVRAIRALDRKDADPAGDVVLRSSERRTVRNLERRFREISEQRALPHSTIREVN